MVRFYLCCLILMVRTILFSPELLLFVVSCYIIVPIVFSLLFWWSLYPSSPLFWAFHNFFKGDFNSFWFWFSNLPVFIFHYVILFFPLIKYFLLAVSSVVASYFFSFDLMFFESLTVYVDFSFLEFSPWIITFSSEAIEHSILLMERGDSLPITYPSPGGSPCSDEPVVLGLYNCDKTWVLQNSCVPLPEESDFGWGFTYFTHKISDFFRSLFSTPDARIDTAIRAARFTLRCFNEINVNHGQTLQSLIQYYLDYGMITKVDNHTFVFFSDAFIPLNPSMPSTSPLPPR